jgi:hypothetical protein
MFPRPLGVVALAGGLQDCSAHSIRHGGCHVGSHPGRQRLHTGHHGQHSLCRVVRGRLLRLYGLGTVEHHRGYDIFVITDASYQIGVHAGAGFRATFGGGMPFVYATYQGGAASQPTVTSGNAITVFATLWPAVLRSHIHPLMQHLR